MYKDEKSNNIHSCLIFNCLICDSRSLKCAFEYGLGGFSVVCVCFAGISTDPERINHVPLCWNLAGYQMGQINYSISHRQKLKWNFVYFFSKIRTQIQTKRNFWNMQLCKVTRYFCWHQEICGLRPDQNHKAFVIQDTRIYFEFSAHIGDQWRVRMFRYKRHGPQKTGCIQSSLRQSFHRFILEHV